MNSKPTLVGHVGAVTGAAISVRQSPTVNSGIAVIGGKSYRIGQVGSFVRIPQGYHDLYGIVAEVGASAAPTSASEAADSGDRWMTIQLVGEIVGASFERGISQYPNVKDEVHLVTEEDLAVIYGTQDGGQVMIGRLASAEGIPVRIDLNKLVTRHSAVLGSTGAGKSTAVASLLRSIASGGAGENAGFPSARILLLDIHGEYGHALRSVSTVFRVNAGADEQPLHIPFWALDPADLLTFLMGKLDDKQLSQILDRIFDYKTAVVNNSSIAGLDLNSMTVDSPVPYSLNKLWFELLDPEIKTWADQPRTVPALDVPGDAATLKPPRYRPHGAGATPPFINQIGVLGIRRPLDQMRSRMLDRQYDFLLHPGAWEPNLSGASQKDLPDLLQAWLGHDKPITILDLSGIPSTVVARLIGAILKIIYEGLFWARAKSEGGIARPLLVVMEEAHRYLSKESDGPARAMVQRIAKEGRKFGIGAMVVSQRPSEVDETILSQCGTFVTLRLSNAADRAKVQASLPDNLAGVADSLPVLRVGEAIITGEAARLPIRCRITLPDEKHRPNSEDPAVANCWQRARLPEDYQRVAASWRAQNPTWTTVRAIRTPLSHEEIEKMERETVESSTVLSIGYEPTTGTLEIEFKTGRLYQYYNVPEPIYQQFLESDSKGKFLHAYIKPAYPYSQV
ncbi:helicase HerA domain-containing protein [Ralstonia pseudosolanacearum]|uniref:helicase HerA domain-containing protein n=2 Tax=Ralstonia pseudosolanacearum TaxID=1310165 RepID=UPI003CF2354B